MVRPRPVLSHLPIYSRTVRIVSTRGLTLVEQQRRLAIRDAEERERGHRQIEQPPCSRRWRHTMGLPCKHELAAYVEDESLVLDRSLFDPHWVIPGGQRALDEPRLLDPRIRLKRRLKRADNHRRNEGIHGTAREPTRAERLDPNHPSTPPPNAPLPRNVDTGFINPRQERRDAEPGQSVLPATRPQRVSRGCMCRKGCGTASCPCKKQGTRCTKDCHRGFPRCSNRDNEDENNAAAAFTQITAVTAQMNRMGEQIDQLTRDQRGASSMPQQQAHAFYPPPPTQQQPLAFCPPTLHPLPTTQPFFHPPALYPPPQTQPFLHPPPPTQPFLPPPPPTEPFYPPPPAQQPHTSQPQPMPQQYPREQHAEEEGQYWQQDAFVESYNPPRVWQRMGHPRWR